MLVTNHVVAEMHVDRSLLLRDGAEQSVYASLVRAVIAEADKSAWKVRPESVHVRVAGVSDDGSALYIGIWSPTAARLIGGEYDGDTVQLSRDEASGLPLDVLRLPYRDAPTFAEALDPRPGSHPAYRRAGTHPINDVWIYEFIA